MNLSTTPSKLLRPLLLLPLVCLAAAATDAGATTVAQNVSWTIDRPESEVKYRVVAYGDSIFAGYKGSISRVAIWSAPSVDGDYLSALWGTDIEIVRRTKSGAKAQDIYTNKIVDDKSYMQSADTRVVSFEMCGNDALQARDDFSGQGSECNYEHLDNALADCTTYQEAAMVFINANAGAGTLRKIIANLYYPGYDADNVEASCTDPVSGLHPNKQDVFLGYLMRMNWRACNFAKQHGFECADTFAMFMGSDYDSNLDGKKDSRALRFRRRESEEAYVERIGTTLRATLRDANAHFYRSTTSYDFIQTDDTHPTYEGGTVSVGTFGGSGGGSSAPRLDLSRYRNGRTSLWKRFGHDRMGWEMSRFDPPAP
jgi:hypothetical protein